MVHLLVNFIDLDDLAQGAQNSTTDSDLVGGCTLITGENPNFAVSFFEVNNALLDIVL